MEYDKEKREVTLGDGSKEAYKKAEEEWRKKEGKPKKSKMKSLLIWTLIIVVLVVVGIFISGGFGFSNIFKNGGSTFVADSSNQGSPFIGTVYVEGEIGSGNVDSFGIPYGYQHQWTLDQIEAMMRDKNNKGILLYVDSPGGGVFESDELYLKIKKYKEMTGRPVYAAMGSMAASGGYYVAASADKIYANRNTWTGSIGVTIGTLFDVSGLLDKYGIKTKTIAEGRNKAMGGIADPLTKEQEDILRGLVHEAYMQFVTVVSTERNIDVEKTKAIADGRVYTAKQAKTLNLIDGILTLEETKDKMVTQEKLKQCNFLDVQYEDNSVVGKLLGKINLSKEPKGDLDVLMNIVEKESRFPIAYLYQ